MSKRSWIEVHENETFSDNTGVCAQCRTCRFRLSKIIRGKDYGAIAPICEQYSTAKPDAVTKPWRNEQCPKYEPDAPTAELMV